MLLYCSVGALRHGGLVAQVNQCVARGGTQLGWDRNGRILTRHSAAVIIDFTWHCRGILHGIGDSLSVSQESNEDYDRDSDGGDDNVGRHAHLLSTRRTSVWRSGRSCAQ